MNTNKEEKTELQSLLGQYYEAYMLMNKLFTFNQLDEINAGMDYDLSLKEIETYADPDIGWDEMRKKRCDIMDKYASNKIRKDFFKRKKK